MAACWPASAMAGGTDPATPPRAGCTNGRVSPAVRASTWGRPTPVTAVTPEAVIAIRTEEAGAFALAHPDVDVDVAGVAFIGGVVLAQIELGRVVMTVAVILGIADAGGKAAVDPQLVVGHMGNAIGGPVGGAPAGAVAVEGAGRIAAQGLIAQVLQRRVRDAQVQSGGGLRAGGACSRLGQRHTGQGQAQQQGKQADHERLRSGQAGRPTALTLAAVV